MKQKLIYISLKIAILCFISMIVCNYSIKKNASTKLYTKVTIIPFNDVGLLFGTKVYAGLKTQVRELFARVKVFINMAIDKQPHFLGEKVIIGNIKM